MAEEKAKKIEGFTDRLKIRHSEGGRTAEVDLEDLENNSVNNIADFEARYERGKTAAGLKSGVGSIAPVLRLHGGSQSCPDKEPFKTKCSSHSETTSTVGQLRDQ